MRFAPSRRLVPAVTRRPSFHGSSVRAAAGVSGSKHAIEAMGACMLVAVFVAIALFG